ncbi:MAG TPA: hypothetical protein VGI31_08725 [Streptosporangiaceae bacterium]
MRNPAGGGASFSAGLTRLAGPAAVPHGPAEPARPIVARYSLTPTAPETVPATAAGIVIVPLASRTRWPFTM